MAVTWNRAFKIWSWKDAKRHEYYLNKSDDGSMGEADVFLDL